MILAILNPFQKLPNVDDMKVLYAYDEEAIHRFLDSNKRVIKTIILSIELIWNNNFTSDQLAFKILKDLRLNRGINIGIILTGFNPDNEKKLLSFDGEFRYWREKGLTYIPFTELLMLNLDEITRRTPGKLDKDYLEDIRQNVYGLDGWINEVFHDLSNDLDSLDKQRNFMASIDNAFERIIRFKKDQQDALTEIKSRFLDDYKAYPRESLDLAENDVISLLCGAPEPPPPIAPEKQRTILLIDDDPDKDLISSLESCKIIVVVKKEIPNEFGQWLRKNNCSTVIVGFRYYDSQKRITQKQGYHFIDEILKKNCPVSIICLTGGGERRISWFKKKYGKLVTVISRRRIHGANSKTLHALVIGRILHEDSLKVKADLEKYASPFMGDLFYAGLYKQHISSDDFLEWEEETNRKVLKILELIYAIRHKGDGAIMLNELKRILENYHFNTNFGSDQSKNLRNRLDLEAVNFVF